VRANLKTILYMYSHRKGISVVRHSLHLLSGEHKMNSWTSKDNQNQKRAARRATTTLSGIRNLQLNVLSIKNKRKWALRGKWAMKFLPLQRPKLRWKHPSKN